MNVFVKYSPCTIIYLMDICNNSRNLLVERFKIMCTSKNLIKIYLDVNFSYCKCEKYFRFANHVFIYRMPGVVFFFFYITDFHKKTILTL